MLQHFLSFDKLIGTKLIKVLYFVGLIGIALAGIMSLFGAIMSLGGGFFLGLRLIAAAIFGTVVALLFWRFMCEIYLLFFRMSDDLRDIKNHQLGRPANNTDV